MHTFKSSTWVMEAGGECYSHGHPVLYCMYKVSLGSMGPCLKQSTKANLGEFYNLESQVIKTLLNKKVFEDLLIVSSTSELESQMPTVLYRT